MEIDWIEVYGESRDFDLSRKSISKVFTFIVTSDDFLSEAVTQTIPGTDTVLYFDDGEMQKYVIPAFFSLVPLVYQFWVSPTQYFFLYVTQMTGKQLNWRQWKITVTFEIPEDNGQSQGGGGGNTGPSNGEGNSQEFTQVSFNSSISMEKRQTGLLLEIQNALSVVDALPYSPGPGVFMGLTDDGIEGADVPVRNFSFNITQYMSPEKFTYEYARRLARLAACINKEDFFGFAPGSVMSTGGQATGHLYQNIPVTLEFDVRTNFKFSKTEASKLAPIDDEFEYDADGNKKVITTNQYDIYKEPLFNDSALSKSASTNQADGVYSGWAIVQYLYAAQVKTDSKRVIRTPTQRMVFLPEDVLFEDFNNFLL